VVTATQQRAAADYLRETYRISQRRAGWVLGRSRSTIRYRRRQRSGEDALIKAIRRLARRHPRYGYKRILARLRHQGWRVNGNPAAQFAELQDTEGIQRRVQPRFAWATA
jgi:hypothetical protein